MKQHNRRKIRVHRRKVAVLAAYSRKHTVNNCTIPKVDKDLLVEGTSTWNEDRKILYAKDTAKWDAAEWYEDQRDSVKKAIKEAEYNANSNPSGKYKYFTRRKKPWYMLDTRKRLHYEERKHSWGAETDFFRVPSESTEMYNKTIFRPKGRAWFMEQMVQHKIAKWEKKNPCPIKEDNSPDLFEEEFIVPWKAEREVAIERIRNFVVSIYDKLPLTGRFKQTENKYVEEKVAEIKDIEGEGHKINELIPEKSKLLKKAQKVTNKVKAKSPNLVCTNLKDHKRQRGRIILPKAA